MIGRTFRHYLGVLRGTELPHTQTSQAERDLLVAHVRGRKWIVEVGVFEGFTTRVIADNADADAIVYGVDPFFPGRLGIPWGLRIARQYNRRHLKSGKLRLVRTLSTEVGTAVPEKVDYVFIDADHSLAAIRDDWKFWSARVVPGGVIALHDTLLAPGKPASSEFGSHKYFREHIQREPAFDLIAQVDSLSVLRMKRTD